MQGLNAPLNVCRQHVTAVEETCHTPDDPRRQEGHIAAHRKAPRRIGGREPPGKSYQRALLVSIVNEKRGAQAGESLPVAALPRTPS